MKPPSGTVTYGLIRTVPTARGLGTLTASGTLTMTFEHPRWRELLRGLDVRKDRLALEALLGPYPRGGRR